MDRDQNETTTSSKLPNDGMQSGGKSVSATGVHPSFSLRRRESIATLNLVVEEYVHNKTGAIHYHLASDNSENVFLVAFRTVPMDSRGVAHILEHTVLCGSERYPVRDPFFMMIRRSLNTFMNAFTSSDWTAYPFASQNRKDFYNLLDVYLDAVFFSRLHELDFAQEGHRVEFEAADDPNSLLVYKGVVFNEMKGAMSSPVSTLWQTLTKYLFPTTTYHYNSGGDPEHIPDLTYSQLKEFYRTHYHPSNAIFVTYGDIPAYEYHARFEEKALARFDKLDTHISVSDEKRYYAPIAVEESYAIDDNEQIDNKSHIVIGWLLGHSTVLEDLLRARLLSSVLLDNSSSPLRHALETSDLGSAPSPLCGIEDSNREMSFICGIEGATTDSADAVEQLILSVLEEVAEDGVAQDKIEAALHQLELNQREIGGDGYPYGLQLILEGLSAATHGGDPVAVLNLDPVLERLRNDIQDPEFIKRLVREWLLDNTHRVRLTLKPDSELSARRERSEIERLQRIKAAMDQEDKRRVVEQAANLAARQRQHDDASILPKVGLEDIPPQMPAIPHQKLDVGSVPASFYPQGTNGLVYQQIVVAMPTLDKELLAVLPYYTHCLTEVGCGDKDYLATQAWQDSVSGGLNAYSSMRGAIDDVQTVQAYFVLSGKALTRNHRDFSELLKQTYKSVHFDEYSRIGEIMSQLRAQRERSITGNGHGYAMIAASSGLSTTAHLAHRLRGLEGIRQLKRISDTLKQDNNTEKLAAQFQALHQSIIESPHQFLLIAEQQQQLLDDLAQCWQAQTQAAVAGDGFSYSSVTKQVRQLWITNTQVNFCAKAYPTVASTHPDAPALTVLGGFLRNGFLHGAIREQGGAYGGGAGQESSIAAFRFYSYRDPRLQETLADFDHAIEWLLTNKHSSSQLEEAILGVISSVDKPGSPAGEAKEDFHNRLFGRTPELREQFRSGILAVTIEDLQRVGETYLRPENASVAVITSNASLEQIGDMGMQVQRL